MWPDLKRHRQRCFYSCHSPFSHRSLSLNTESDWHCNHPRVSWHQIRLFVNAEHSREFIFIQCISSVTYSECSDSEHTLGTPAVEVHQSIQIITAVAI